MSDMKALGTVMGRRTIWRRTITLQFVVPEDSDDPFQLPRIEHAVHDETTYPACNSVKVNSWDEAVGSVLGDLAVYLQREGRAWAEFQRELREADGGE